MMPLACPPDTLTLAKAIADEFQAGFPAFVRQPWHEHTALAKAAMIERAERTLASLPVGHSPAIHDLARQGAKVLLP